MPVFPISNLDEALTMGGFSKSDIEKVKKHEVVHVKLDTLTERELAAGFAFLAKKKPEDLENVFITGEGKQESDETIQQIGFSDPDGNLDFSTLKLLPEASSKDMTKAYLNCSAGDDLNLSKEEMDLFHALGKNGTREQVEEVLRKVLTNRIKEYQNKGLEGIAPYQRKGSAFEPGKELLERTLKSKMAQKVAPDFIKHMVEYPNSKPDGDLKEMYCWYNFEIDKKPTVAIVHKMSWKMEDAFVMMQRHFYVSRGHNSVQSMGACIPFEDQCLMFFSSRTSTDLVSGFGGAAKRAMGSRIMGGKLAANFDNYRKTLGY